jgi:hypothetical protein
LIWEFASLFYQRLKHNIGFLEFPPADKFVWYLILKSVTVGAFSVITAIDHPIGS